MSEASSPGVSYHVTAIAGSPPVAEASTCVRSKVLVSSVGVLPLSSSSHRNSSKGPRSKGSGSTTSSSSPKS